MPKLHLKETKADREERELKKIRRAARKAARYHNYEETDGASGSTPSTHKRRSKAPSQKPHDYVFDEEDGWTPPQSSVKFDYRDDLQAQEDEFRAKLFDEMELDAGQDAAQARFSDYHIPTRWRDQTGFEASGSIPQSKTAMDEEEYAEYIRRGMWERTHAAEKEAREQKDKDRKERKDREKTLREKTKELEREEREKRRRKLEAKANEQFVEGWKAYERRWAALHQAATTSTNTPGSLGLHTLPWPVAKAITSADDLTRDAISAFLLSPHHSPDKPKRIRLREALLLYHPDRFEGRFMSSVPAQDRQLVKDAVGRVARALTSLAEDAVD